MRLILTGPGTLPSMSSRPCSNSALLMLHGTILWLRQPMLMTTAMRKGMLAWVGMGREKTSPARQVLEAGRQVSEPEEQMGVVADGLDDPWRCKYRREFGRRRRES